MKRTSMVGQLFAGAALFCVLSPAFGALFSVGPASSFDISGTLSITILDPISSSGSGPLVEQGPNSLHSTLSGLINASVSASAISFAGGSVFNALPSGNWQPSGLPASFGFQVEIPLSGPLTGNSLKFVGDIQDLSFFLTGTKPLSGAPGNQTFDTAGLELTSLGGTTDLQAFACTTGQPSSCTDLGTQTMPPDNSDPPEILPAGAGSLALVGNTLTLSLPVRIETTLSDTQIVDVEGIPVTINLAGNLALTGNIVATIVPEPSTWAMLCLGLAAIGLMWRRLPFAGGGSR